MVRLAEREPDHVSDCFLYICERLRENQFQRLRRYKPESQTRFSTWVWVVARNLCRDWRRQEFGRFRVFKSIRRLSSEDQEVFRCLYEQGLSKEATLAWMRAHESAFTAELLEASIERIEQNLTPRQQWLLTLRNHREESLDRDAEGKAPSTQIHDPAPDPEASLALKERHRAIESALRGLSKADRLLIALRYEKDLTLKEIAPVLGFKDVWAVERKLKQILEQMRRQIDSPEVGESKTGDVSV